MTRPAVSVVIPTHNGAATLGLQLEALSRQEDPPPFEVLVVDNRSTDDLLALIDHWRDGLPGLQLIDASAHPGAGYARNVGARGSAGDQLLFCDADDLVARDWVRQGAQALDETGLACGSDVTLADAAFTDIDTLWRDHLDAMPQAPIERASGPSSYPIVLGGNLAVRTQAFRDIGGFDISMRKGNEDNDFAIRAEQSGHLIDRAPGMRIAIRERGTLRGFYRRARVAGEGHIELCARHDLWRDSPHLRGNAWRLDPLRAAGAGVKMLAKPADQRDWRAVATRAGAAVGLWEGDLRRRITGGGPAQIGVGLT